MDNNQFDMMFNLLSQDRQNHIMQLLNNMASDLHNKIEKEVVHTIEITEKFDKEEPKQFVYMKIGFEIYNNPKLINPTNAIASKFSISELEVFKEDSINDWLDHVTRIEKNDDKKFYQKDGTVVKSISNKTEKSNTYEFNLPNDNGTSIPLFGMPFPESQFSQPQQGDSTPLPPPHIQTMTDEEKIKVQEWRFGISDGKDAFTVSEYIDKFRIISAKSMSNFVSSMDVDDQSESHDKVDSLISCVKSLYECFRSCDFTKWFKEELEQVGFIRYGNDMLIPAWAYPVILKNNKGLVVRDVIDKPHVIGKKFISLDCNYTGCIPYALCNIPNRI